MCNSCRTSNAIKTQCLYPESSFNSKTYLVKDLVVRKMAFRILSFLVVLVCFSFVFHDVDSTTLNILTDKEALISIKSQMSLKTPTPISSWDQKLSPCNWTGVTCNKIGSRVVALDLSSFGLVGSLSPSIGNLSFLHSLQLQNNQLSGPLPNQITNLFRLRVMNMSFNNFGGVILSNLSKFTELRVLDLMTNRITGNVPSELSHLKNLQVLNLGRNLLSGRVPPSISNLSSLTTLNLGTNTLSGPIPTELYRLQNLKHLDLTINNLTGTVPPSIYNMSSLVSLALAANQLWGKLPSDVGVTLPNLLVFNFCFNKFTGGIPGSLHNLTNIKVIRMAHNLLEGTVPPGLGNLPFLQMYNIGFNKIVSESGKGLDFLTSLTNSSRLNFLAIDGNLFEGTIPESIGNLSKVLTKLYMGENRINGTIPSSIGRLSSLALLDLGNNLLTGGIPPEIGELKELQLLNLAGNQLSGVIPNSLGNLKKLNQIDFSRNELVGIIPSSFGNFQSLLSMDLSNNRLSGSISKEILNLPSLSTFLNLSKNFLTGPLPQDVSQLKSVVTIDLSDNRLSGNIPDSIGGCNSLQHLFLARNLFSGSIPNSLADVKGLETLDLSSNQLSGYIPDDLEKIRALRSLNLSFNSLEGAIPNGGVFRNLSNVHLEGNPKLCHRPTCQSSRGRKKVARVYITVAIVAAVALEFAFVVFSLLFLRKNKARVAKVTANSEMMKDRHQIVSYSELRSATGDFNRDNLIGSGSFGSVYKGYLRDGIAVAIKVIDIKRTGFLKSFLAECEALRNVRHRNLLKLVTSCSSLDVKNMEFLALVYEFLCNGSLDDWIKGKRTKSDGAGLSLVERLNVAIDIAYALDYMHNDCEVPVVHCDLKPSNILLDEDMTAKIGDFGLARLLTGTTGDQGSISSTHVLKGSIGYIPPEYGLGKKPTTAGDVYSFGVMLLELFTGKSPTDEYFVGELNIVKWVQSNFPTDVLQILDPELVFDMDDVEHDNEFINLNGKHDCLITIFGVGLSCTVGSSDARINGRDVVHKLKSAREGLSKKAKVNHE